MKNLVIVESPAKAKTIEKFLGEDYKVMSSFGHIRDLSKKDLGLTVGATDFSPAYEIPDDKKELVRSLRAAAKQAQTIWLASDEDREGEAIAWHLCEVLGLNPEETRRIVFHEITKPAILHAIANPRSIDIDRVNAQQARRVLDRIVGFELSPVLWKKIKPALSAGRVQSVAVRLICEREKDVNAFTAEQYYRINALFSPMGTNAVLKAEYSRRVASEEEARTLMQGFVGADFRIAEIIPRQTLRTPPPPFTTSTLQQEANRKLGYSVNQTMVIAQQLYEAGHITYMRTDSLNLSKLAQEEIASEIKEKYGEKYLHQRNYHTNSKGAQEAHEAIRPTYISKRRIDAGEREQRLYDLIWRRAVASQMADAVVQKTNVHVSIQPADGEISPNTFHAEGEVITFPGYVEVYNPEILQKDNALPPLSEGETLSARDITATERFTLPPARYTEATLVKKMEDLGIGRPSTYAPTISTIQQRDYVRKGEKEGEKREYNVLVLRQGDTQPTLEVMEENSGAEKGKLLPTDVGMIVNDFLTQYFPDILDYNFTARVEEKFDEIAEGKLPWKREITDFYGGFHPSIEEINAMRMEHKVGERILGTDPKTGKPVSVKIGRFGPVAQIGDTNSEEKPTFASLQADQSLSTITLEEALKLFDLPRDLGTYEDKKVVAAVGRFGPYIRHNSVFVSIPKDLTPQGITLDEAITLIEEKRAKDAARIIKRFEERPDLEILNGRFGPYIAYKPEGAKKAVNYKIPKTTVAAELTLPDVEKLMKAQDAAPKKKTRKS